RDAVRAAGSAVAPPARRGGAEAGVGRGRARRGGCGGGPDRGLAAERRRARGRAVLRPRPLLAARALDRRGLFRPAHGEAVVPGKDRLFAPREGPGRRWVRAGGGSPRLSRR